MRRVIYSQRSPREINVILHTLTDALAYRGLGARAETAGPIFASGKFPKGLHLWRVSISINHPGPRHAAGWQTPGPVAFQTVRQQCNARGDQRLEIRDSSRRGLSAPAVGRYAFRALQLSVQSGISMVNSDFRVSNLTALFLGSVRSSEAAVKKKWSWQL